MTYICKLNIAGRLSRYIGHVVSDHLDVDFPTKLRGETGLVPRSQDVNFAAKFSG